MTEGCLSFEETERIREWLRQIPDNFCCDEYPQNGWGSTYLHRNSFLARINDFQPFIEDPSPRSCFAGVSRFLKIK